VQDDVEDRRIMVLADRDEGSGTTEIGEHDDEHAGTRR
jgi:hypothetical protein